MLLKIDVLYYIVVFTFNINIHKKLRDDHRITFNADIENIQTRKI